MPRLSLKNRPVMEADGECWADIAGYEGLYKVSNLGRIRRLETTTIETTANGEIVSIKHHEPYILKTTLNNHHGYMACGLTRGNTTTTYRVHRLVADAFLPHNQVETEVHHIDCNSLNNSVSNLEWVSADDHHDHHRRKHHRTYLP